MSMSMDQMISMVVGIFVVAILAAYLLPSAISAFFSTNTSSWDAGTANIWGVLPIFIVIAILLVIIAAVAVRKK